MGRLSGFRYRQIIKILKSLDLSFTDKRQVVIFEEKVINWP